MLPLSLYIHIPWCIRKCPYCDFNSHQSPARLPEKAYIQSLIDDLEEDLRHYPTTRCLESIFIGGGTPSLLGADAYDTLFTALKQRLPWVPHIEITLEANPGTLEHGLFAEYRALGINRLSLGIQSFNPQHLQRLGRIHDDKQAHRAIREAYQAGFSNLNLDIMYGLPGQGPDEAIADLQQALAHEPRHLSWYQLTIEPNTPFYKSQPILPDEECSADMEARGLKLLQDNGFERYEISAFCQKGYPARHNLNYWLFGDYYGIGAGAHGKLSDDTLHTIVRTQKKRQPKDYLAAEKAYSLSHTVLDPKTLVFEFMLNTTRLEQAIDHTWFTQRTGLSHALLHPGLQVAATRGLVQLFDASWQVTPLGRRFTNDLQALFLP